jgi:hypothetical protein
VGLISDAALLEVVTLTMNTFQVVALAYIAAVVSRGKRE